MGYILLADLIAVVHFAFLAFVVVGQLFILVGILRRWQWVRNFWFRIIHLLFIGIVVVEQFVQVQCPLTVWEADLRVMAEQPRSEQSFTARLVHQVIFCEDMNWDDPALAWTYYAFGGIVLASFLMAPPRLPGRRKAKKEGSGMMEARGTVDGRQLDG